jgi:hypothetical protein
MLEIIKSWVKMWTRGCDDGGGEVSSAQLEREQSTLFFECTRTQRWRDGFNEELVGEHE